MKAAILTQFNKSLLIEELKIPKLKKVQKVEKSTLKLPSLKKKKKFINN